MTLAEPKEIRGDGSVRYGDDSGIFAVFFKKPIQDKEETEKQGRPIFNDVVHIKAQPLGDKTTIVERVATENDKKRFAAQWRAYEESKNQEVIEGQMPLEEWVQVTRSQVLELKALGIHTVEALSQVTDGFLNKFMGFRELHDKAKKWLESSDDNRVRDLEQEVEKLKALLSDNKKEEKNDGTGGAKPSGNSDKATNNSGQSNKPNAANNTNK